MAAAKYNIIIDQYQDYARGFQITQDNVVQDLTGWNFTAQVRERTQCEHAYDFTVVVIDAPQGLINMVMTDDITSTIPPGNYVYDLVATKDTLDKVRLLEGQAKVVAGVTR